MMIPVIFFVLESEDERERFLRFYMKYERLMYAKASEFRIGGVDPADIIQESLCRIIEKKDTFLNLSEFKQVNYVKTTIYNTACGLYNKAKHEAAKPLDEEYMCEELCQDDAGSFEDFMIHAMVLEAFVEALNHVPDEYRTLLERKYILNQSDKEIAGDLNVKQESVRMYLTRARRKVKDFLLKQRNFQEYL